MHSSQILTIGRLSVTIPLIEPLPQSETLDIGNSQMMKSLITKIIATAVIAVTLAGCGTVVQESAMEWLQRQPQLADD